MYNSIMSTIAKLSVPEYEQIVATGIFGGKNKRRIELIWGELREKNPIGSEHATVVVWLTEWSFDNTPRKKVMVRPQNPVAFLSADSEPEPDIVWAKRQNYARHHPLAEDVLLLIEVAESSLAYDRGEKASLYATAGIQDYWIVNLIDRTVEVRRDPDGGGFRNIQTLGAGSDITPLAMPEAKLNLDSLFASLE
jgi:Uma2 family endonuclease